MLYPNADILEFLFATVATIIATLTGLIGAFSTFRLQNILAEIQLLKGLLIDKVLPDGKQFKDYVQGDNYYLYEKIYDTNAASITILEQLVADNLLAVEFNELLIDIDNIRRNQLRHDKMRVVTIAYFKRSLIFVFVSILLLVFSNGLLATGRFIWIILLVYLSGVGYAFNQFVQQLKQLV